MCASFSSELNTLGANIPQLQLLAADLLRDERYVSTQLYDPNERLIESIVC